MIDRKHIGHTFKPFTTTVEAGKIRLFCKAIGETNPIYSDEAAAKAAGYAGIPAPVTFVTAIANDDPDKGGVLNLVGVDIGWILHGEQHYEYLKPIHAGDRITCQTKITDIYDKKGGALEFIVTQTEMKNQQGEPVCMATSTIVVRRPQQKAA